MDRALNHLLHNLFAIGAVKMMEQEERRLALIKYEGEMNEARTLLKEALLELVEVQRQTHIDLSSIGAKLARVNQIIAVEEDPIHMQPFFRKPK